MCPSLNKIPVNTLEISSFIVMTLRSNLDKFLIPFRPTQNKIKNKISLVYKIYKSKWTISLVIQNYLLLFSL